MVDLEVTARELECSLRKMDTTGNSSNSEDGDVGPGLQIPTTHKAIFGHSRRGPHVKWAWITKYSTVDANGNLGFPASREEVRKFEGGI
jgi:hypothetical protein